MTEWNDMTGKPDGVFDVLARYYDAGLNRFLLQRFTGCVLVDLTIVWPMPFPNDGGQVYLEKNGYRAVAWKPAPGPEDVPEWLDAFVTGPQDRSE